MTNKSFYVNFMYFLSVFASVFCPIVIFHFHFTSLVIVSVISICFICRESQQDLFNAMGSMYAAVLFIGITNATAVQPVVSIERFVSYRERAAGMYSGLAFAFAQVYLPFSALHMISRKCAFIFSRN